MQQSAREVLSRRPIFVFVDLSGVRRIGEVVKINSMTTWVKVRSGAQSFDYIQRHNEKHHVTFYRMDAEYNTEEVPTDETINTKAGE